MAQKGPGRTAWVAKNGAVPSHGRAAIRSEAARGRAVPSDATEKVASGAMLRGLTVLEALNEQHPLTLAQLHERTAIPKPTLLRLLETLCQAGYIKRDAGPDGFRPSPKLYRLTQGIDPDSQLRKVAGPPMHRLGHLVGWPSDLALRNGDLMVIRLSTRSSAPIRLAEPIVQSGLQILRSELGIAYLSRCEPAERDRILRLVNAVPPDDLGPVPNTSINDVIAKARARKYALRSDYVDVRELNAIAIPIVVGKRVIASLSLVFHSRAIPVPTLVETCLAPLQSTASLIASALSDASASLNMPGRQDIWL